MDFHGCVLYCAGQTEFVQQWESLTGYRLMLPKAKTPLEAMIDRAVKFEPAEETMRAFIHDVYDIVWSRLPAEAFEPHPSTKGE